MEVHRGELLRQTLKKYCKANGVTLTYIARQVGYDQSTLYKHFDKEDLDYHIIRKYGKAIKHDFRMEYPSMENDYLSIIEETGEDGKTMEECLKEIEHWKMKYLSLLEKHNQLLTERVNNN